MAAEACWKELDPANIPNSALIGEHTAQTVLPSDKYSVAYTWGLVCIVYNRTMVDEGDLEQGWGILWDEKYAGQVLMFNNSRDAFAIAGKLLGNSINPGSVQEIEQAAEKLKEQKSVVQSYVMDEVFDKMGGGEAALAPYYVGDGVTMMADNPDLAMFIPAEGTNIYIDAMCIPKGSRNKEAAEMFINFMCETQVAAGQCGVHLLFLAAGRGPRASGRRDPGERDDVPRRRHAFPVRDHGGAARRAEQRHGQGMERCAQLRRRGQRVGDAADAGGNAGPFRRRLLAQSGTPPAQPVLNAIPFLQGNERKGAAVLRNGGAPVCRKRLRQRRIGARKHRFWTDGFGAQRTQTAWQSTRIAKLFSRTVHPKPSGQNCVAPQNQKFLLQSKENHRRHPLWLSRRFDEAMRKNFWFWGDGFLRQCA
jgi:hypothetical protein